jgi:hypothetical protein
VIIEILFVVTLFLWFLTALPHPALAPFATASNYFAFAAVLLLRDRLLRAGLRAMNILVLLLVLILLFGGGGFYFGGPHLYAGGGIGLVLLIVLLVVLLR